MRRKERGFSLIEALIALAAAALLLAVAVPAWSAASAKAHTTAAKASMATTVLDAVRHSSVTATEVVVCPSADGLACATTTRWEDGWLAFADRDGNRRPGPGETRLRHADPLGGSIRMRSTSGRTRLVFQPHGGNAGSNVTFTLCDGRGSRHATTLVLSNSGNMRQGIPTQNAALACVHGG